MELDERKSKILKAIIQNYQETGEPVGSRTISKYSDLSLSSATIRNEMSDLEEMGLIVQPHTSAGRVPTDLAYRMYVDQLMKEDREKETEKAELSVPDQKSDFLIKRMDRMELMLEQVARIVADKTNYAAMVSSPRINQTKLKFIQLSRVDEYKLLMVLVVEGNIIRNKIFDIHEDLRDQDILSLNLLLNSNLNGLTMDEINLGVITHLTEQAGVHKDIVNRVLEEVAKAIRPDHSVEVYTSGATNIFKYPELSDNETASEILDTFEEKKQLAKALSDGLKADGHKGIRVYIGDETPVDSMKDCSIVTATYELSDGLKGTIGIVGPKRMDYPKVMKTLETLMQQLNAIFPKVPELEKKEPDAEGDVNIVEPAEDEKE
ncbi:MAG: heat-inducible transcription repressor HrcA [Lachnospiraceae bacterium]|nr:heat-inducible transcription repressor HrcA [Lachnospiraceae bacterium]